MDNNIHPNHYKQGGIECIDAIRSALTPEEYRGFCKGNMIKYIWRERTHNGNEDITKASAYAAYILEADRVERQIQDAYDEASLKIEEIFDALLKSIEEELENGK